MVGLTTSHEIWTSLEANFAGQSKAKIMQYRLQLQSSKKESQSMREYLGKVKCCCDALAAAGCRISEDDQILYVLGGLGSEYDPVMVAISARTDPWTMQEVTSLLHSFESRLDAAKSTKINMDGSTPSLNVAQTTGQRADANNRFNKQDKSGRMSGYGYGFRGGRGGRSGGRGRLTCQLCQKPGHTSGRCWYRFEQSFMPQPSQPRPNHQSYHSYGNPQPSANIAQARGGSYHSPANDSSHDSSSSVSWYPDSGATHHVSSDLSNLNSAYLHCILVIILVFKLLMLVVPL